MIIEKLEKLGSRKFLVTVSALTSALMQDGNDPVKLIVVSVIAAIYVLAEGLIDRARAQAS